jgi:transglutaminase/protease-like cytokinesis protein 3
MAAKTNFILLVLIVNNAFVFGQITAHKIDSTLLPLALSITENAPRDSDKVVAIYQWMFKHLEYDFESVINERKGTPTPDSFQQPAIAIRRKKAVCDGYSRIFRDFCLLNGVFATSIVGYTSFNDLTDSAQVLHAWNAVKVNNQWYLMDITWEDAELDFQQNKATMLKDAAKKNKLSPHENLLKHINKKRSHRLVDNLKTNGKDAERIATANLSGFVDSTALNTPDAVPETDKSPIFAPPATTYLFTSPQVFRTDHLPKDPLWQLTDSVVSLQKFFFQQDPSVSPYFSTHFDYKNRLLELPKLDLLEQERRELSRQFQYNPRDWMVVQNIAYDYTNRVHQSFQSFNNLASAEAPKLIELQQILTTSALYLTQAEGFHRMAGKISTGYAAVNMVENLTACEGYRQHIEQLWEWLKK